MPSGDPAPRSPSAFISYSWDDAEHKVWVLELATRLRRDGVDVTLDQWHVAPGDQLADFMERAIRENDFVIVVCTPHYKERSDRRAGGVGYEGDIMTAEVLTRRNHRKFIPILRAASWRESAPSWLLGSVYLDFFERRTLEASYRDLVATLLGRRPAPPRVGEVPAEADEDTAPDAGALFDVGRHDPRDGHFSKFYDTE